jgi:hypothetical protein
MEKKKINLVEVSVSSFVTKFSLEKVKGGATVGPPAHSYTDGQGGRCICQEMPLCA